MYEEPSKRNKVVEGIHIYASHSLMRKLNHVNHKTMFEAEIISHRKFQTRTTMRDEMYLSPVETRSLDTLYEKTRNFFSSISDINLS